MVEQTNTQEELKFYEQGDPLFETRALTPVEARSLTRSCEKFFCRLQDNDLITFGHYSLRDYETGSVLVEVPEDMQEYAHQVALQ